MQPTYIPWIGYFDLMDSVDQFVFYDDVQLEKGSWQLRNRIKTAQGELFLSVERRRNGKSLLLIKDTLLNDAIDWKERHLKSIAQNYRKSRYFEEVYSFFAALIQKKFERLGEFNIHIIKMISEKIGIKTKLLVSSETFGQATGVKDERLLAICRLVCCDSYLSPQGSAIYIEKDSPGGKFAGSGVELYYQNYEHPVYPQLYGSFLPYMSIVDLLFNCGFDEALEMIRKGRRKPIHYLHLERPLMQI